MTHNDAIRAQVQRRLIMRVCYRCDYSFASTDAETVALWEDGHDAECPAPAPADAAHVAA